MTQALYAHMNNKIIIKKVKTVIFSFTYYKMEGNLEALFLP
jgi:hypothetical protein